MSRGLMVQILACATWHDALKHRRGRASSPHGRPLLTALFEDPPFNVDFCMWESGLLVTIPRFPVYRG